MAIKTQSVPLLKEGEYTVKEVNELNFFDLTGEKAKTAGTSCKMYIAELQVSKNGNKAQIFTMYGPTGSVQRKEWRYFDSEEAARKEYNKILNSKRRKGYKDIDVAQRSLGSDEAKKITKAVVLNNIDPSLNTAKQSTLHSETQRLISTLMGATNSFVIKTLKCPLGQLTNKQIDDGRKCLEEAKKIVSQNRSLKNRLLKLTNEFYTLIPHNLGAGSRGQMTELLLDDINKIAQKEYDLDTLLDAKAIGATLTDSSVDKQYKSLDTDLDFVDHRSDLFKWLNAMVQETKANNHRHLGRVVLLNAWKVKRNKEFDVFEESVSRIAKVCGKQTVPDQMHSLVKKRVDTDNKLCELYKKANVIPLFHGTRTQNLTGILKQGLLIRPSGAVITGAMYGNSIYFGKSSKSINYTSISSSYWAGGSDDKAFLFISDCCLGNQKLASGSYNYTENNIKPNHSVWAKGGYSGVINDEFMLYNTKQHHLRYLLEFTCRKN